jgi:hypothetical protein
MRSIYDILGVSRDLINKTKGEKDETGFGTKC